MKDLSFLNNKIRIGFWKPFAVDIEFYLKRLKKCVEGASEWLLFRFMVGIYTNSQDDSLMKVDHK